MKDDDFVRGLIKSGIPLNELDSAFAFKSVRPLNKLLAVSFQVPKVALELGKVFGIYGKSRYEKYKRVQPVYHSERPETARRTYHRAPGAHDGGKQAKKQLRMNDDDFVRGLMKSGIPLNELDWAFAINSAGRLNKLLAVSFEVRTVALELGKLTWGKSIAYDKFKRVQPVYHSERESGTPDSTLTLTHSHSTMAEPKTPSASPEKKFIQLHLS
jgi:hypothetical protein